MRVYLSIYLCWLVIIIFYPQVNIEEDKEKNGALSTFTDKGPSYRVLFITFVKGSATEIQLLRQLQYFTKH